MTIQEAVNKHQAQLSKNLGSLYDDCMTLLEKGYPLTQDVSILFSYDSADDVPEFSPTQDTCQESYTPADWHPIGKCGLTGCYWQAVEPEG